MTDFELNQFKQQTGKGKLEQTPSSNVFTCKVSDSFTGEGLTAGIAVTLTAEQGAVPTVDKASDTDSIFGFIALGHKINSFRAGEFCRIASDYSVMMMEAGDTIQRGDAVSYSATDGVVIPDTEGKGIGIALDNGHNGGLFRVLIKCLGVQRN